MLIRAAIGFIVLVYTSNYCGVPLGVGVSVDTGVGVGVSVDPGVGVGVSVGVGVDGLAFVNVIVGLWLFGSVTLNPLVVSCTESVTVPFIWDERVNFASPFWVVTFCGKLPLFICVSEFPELTEIFNTSDTGASF